MSTSVIFLVLFCGLHYVGSQESEVESAQIGGTGIKKNEVGANGFVNNSHEILKNFKNPVLEYLFRTGTSSGWTNRPDRGVIREIRHSQTLLLPGIRSVVIPEIPSKSSVKSPRNSDVLNFLKTNLDARKDAKTHESVVTSPLLRVRDDNSDGEDFRADEYTQIDTYPARAILINTYNRDGSLKSSVTHFQPDFASMKNAIDRKEAIDLDYVRKRLSDDQHHRYVVDDDRSVSAERQFPISRLGEILRGDSLWSLVTPVAVDATKLWDLAVSSRANVYNAVSTIVEYKPEDVEKPNGQTAPSNPVAGKRTDFDIGHQRDEEYLTGETTRSSDVVRQKPRQVQRSRIITASRKNRRNRRDTTSVYLRTKDGEKIDITLEEPKEITPKQKKMGDSDLVLRKGGIAIAGPWGAATAYTGGTAIVGPYGTVYKSPQGTAIVGPFSQIVNITDDTDFEEIIKLHREVQSRRSRPPSGTSVRSNPNGFKNYKNFFSYLTNQPIRIETNATRTKARPSVVRLTDKDLKRTVEEAFDLNFRHGVQDKPFDEQVARTNETALVFRPKSKAEAGRNGVAVSAPISHAILFPGQKANIYFEPESVASAGPSGFAHAHSDLFVSYVLNETETATATTTTTPVPCY